MIYYFIYNITKRNKHRANNTHTHVKIRKYVYFNDFHTYIYIKNYKCGNTYSINAPDYIINILSSCVQNIFKL